MSFRILLRVLLIVIAGTAAAHGYESLAPSSSAAATPGDVPRAERRDSAALDGATANLDAYLVGALHKAAADAAGDGVELTINSGWRSPEHQEQLLQEAVAQYGSEEEAARWVATAETSPHVSGDAVDIAPAEAAAWLGTHGAEYGLCQIYANEPWHFELRPEAVDQGCPATYPDPTYDPRMQ